jgi:hypothetical protein
MVRTALYSDNLIERLMVRQQNKSKKNRTKANKSVLEKSRRVGRQQNKSKKNRTKANKSALEKSRRVGRQRGVTTGLREQIDHGPKRSAISTIGVAR